MKDLNCWQTKFESCYYSKRLLAKLDLLNNRASSTKKIDLLAIKKAMYYAKKYHGNQKRQTGEPYYSHPFEVAFMVSDHVFTKNILVTSILHDTLEDTELTKNMLTYIFDPEIAEQIEDLTRIKMDRKITAAETIDLLWLQRKPDLLLVKYFDRIHNLQTINIKSPEKISKIITETLEQFISLGIYFKATTPNLFNADDNILKLCYKQLTFTKWHLLAPNLMQYCEDHFQLPAPIFQNE